MRKYKPSEMEPDQERALGKLSDAMVLEYLMRRFSHSNDFAIKLMVKAQELRAERDALMEAISSVIGAADPLGGLPGWAFDVLHEARRKIEEKP
jgi:predicted transcriptional regulator